MNNDRATFSSPVLDSKDHAIAYYGAMLNRAEASGNTNLARFILRELTRLAYEVAEA